MRRTSRRCRRYLLVLGGLLGVLPLAPLRELPFQRPACPFAPSCRSASSLLQDSAALLRDGLCSGVTRDSILFAPRNLSKFP